MNEQTTFDSDIRQAISLMLELRDQIEELLKERADSAVADLMNQMITALFTVEAKLDQWAETQLQLIPVQERLGEIERNQGRMTEVMDAMRTELSQLVATLNAPMILD